MFFLIAVIHALHWWSPKTDWDDKWLYIRSLKPNFQGSRNASCLCFLPGSSSSAQLRMGIGGWVKCRHGAKTARHGSRRLDGRCFFSPWWIIVNCRKTRHCDDNILLPLFNSLLSRVRRKGKGRNGSLKASRDLTWNVRSKQESCSIQISSSMGFW